MLGAGGDQLGYQAAERVAQDQRRRVKRLDERDEIVGVVAQADRPDLLGAFLERQVVKPQRRRVHGVAALLELRAGVGPTVAAQPRAVDENDVLGVGHGIKRAS